MGISARRFWMWVMLAFLAFDACSAIILVTDQYLATHPVHKTSKAARRATNPKLAYGVDRPLDSPEDTDAAVDSADSTDADTDVEADSSDASDVTNASDAPDATATRTPTKKTVAKAKATPTKNTAAKVKATPTRTRTKAPTRTPTRVVARAMTNAAAPANVQSTPPPLQQLALNNGPAAPARSISFALPASLNRGALALPVPPQPSQCTHASQMPSTIHQSVTLCPGETYSTINISGSNIGIFADSGRTAVIRSYGRGWGIIADGNNIHINGVAIRATTDPNDLTIILCLYPTCSKGNGGVAIGGPSYGGGILLRASNSSVVNSDVQGGVNGVAAVNVRNIALVNNVLDKNTGWGSYNYNVANSYFVGNSFDDDNRGCVGYDGNYQPTGCESAGWVSISSPNNVLAANTCSNSGDCYYMNGEGGQGSNYNKLHGNRCWASPHNCFEATFSLGNEFVGNVTGADPYSGQACQYPFWVGGSQVIFGQNTWACAISVQKSIERATDSTNVPTNVQWAQ